jgi:hypothetical protein
MSEPKETSDFLAHTDLSDSRLLTEAKKREELFQSIVTAATAITKSNF